MTYEKFLQSKIKLHIDSGFDISENQLNPKLFYFQKYIVKMALKKGKFAIFSECGTGKTIMQLSWANQIFIRENKSILILAPLAVSGQTIQEGNKFGIKIEKYNYQKEPGIYITNYEQLDNINENDFIGVVLDESSILKNFTGKIRGKIIDKFDKTPYKLACTATPSPNDPMELGNHSQFLNCLSRNEMLSKYFIHDGGETSKWRLKKHGENEFYKWICSWAIMISKPSDIHFSDKGYDLPELNFIEKQIETDKRDNGLLFNDVAISATGFNAELRLTKISRMDEVINIVNNSKETFIIWIKHIEEEKYLKKNIPDGIVVTGSDSIEYKESKLLGFAKNEFRVLITKSKIAQFGLNYQNCHNQIFASLDFSFESLYQSIRRSYRFGQTENVNIWLITTDTMKNVIEAIERKQKQFTELQNKMSRFVNKFDFEKKDKIKQVNLMDIEKDGYKLFFGDAIIKIKKIPNKSIGFSVFSPPFSSLYTFSDSLEDLSNCNNHDEFYKHFEFLIKELFRVTKDGRLVSVHAMDLTTNIGRNGFLSVIDFRGEIIKLFQKNGFYYHNEITIWKNPVIEVTRTKNIQLLYRQFCKDATISRTSLPDRILTFRKPGENKNPVTHDREILTPSDWGKIASPVWMDINQTRTLQYRSAKDNNDERHISVLQLDVIERLLLLWSNPGDTIFSPFMGIGSEGYTAIKMKRKFIGIELKDTYFELACKNMENAVAENNQTELFSDFTEDEKNCIRPVCSISKKDDYVNVEVENAG